MIRITIHQTDEELVLTLEGGLAGAWAGELEACWSQARSARGGRRLTVDLRGICHVDDRGREAMARLAAEGARFVTSGCVMPELIRELAAGRPSAPLERI